MRRVAITSSASGNGKTTLGRELARRLGVPFVEVDELAYGPGWSELSAEELRARVAPIVATDAWVLDGTYRGKLGGLILGSADVVVWLDLPVRVWLPRLVRRSAARLLRREELWHGNRETWRSTFGGRRSLVWLALHAHFSRRRRYPTLLAPYPVVRLQTPRDVREWLDETAPEPTAPPSAV